ncbi:hypothetical protein MMC10_006652 [Thelotrema lepadinum]|nr:hypothetical protein [Thelotrema lepadinum]
MLSYEDDFDSDGARPSLYSEGLGPFISAARNIRELELNLGWQATSIDVFGAEFQWPKLERLTISALNLYEEHMIGFFSRQGHTLKHLDFSNSNLEDTDCCRIDCWAGFLERIRRESLITLESFRMKSRPTYWPFVHYKLSMNADKWIKEFPDLIPTHRAVQFLMCGKKKDTDDKTDAISLHPYDWDDLSWASVVESFEEYYF